MPLPSDLLGTRLGLFDPEPRFAAENDCAIRCFLAGRRVPPTLNALANCRFEYAILSLLVGLRPQVEGQKHLCFDVGRHPYHRSISVTPVETGPRYPDFTLTRGALLFPASPYGPFP